MTDFDRKLSRRAFIARSVAALAAGAAIGPLSSCFDSSGPGQPFRMPRRRLGGTGLDVSILSFGGGSYFLQNSAEESSALLERALEAGIDLFDTCSCYVRSGSPTSEERFGEVLPAHRKHVTICTKFDSRAPDAIRAEVDQSLRRMKTDYVDILLIHNVRPADTLAGLDPAYRTLALLKEEGITRRIGFSCMDSAERSRELLENLAFDVVMLAMSPTRYGDFAGIALPAARARNVGVIAMKVMAGVVGTYATPRELLEYAWGIDGIASAVVGTPFMALLEENAGIAVDYGKRRWLDRSPEPLEERLAPLAGPHVLPWTRPGYRDGGAC